MVLDNNSKFLYNYNRSELPKTNINISDREIIEDITLMYLTEDINIYYTIVILPIGILVNLISAWVYSRKNLNKTSFGALYLILCILNTAALLISIILKVIIYNDIDAFVKASIPFCRIAGLLHYVFLQAPSFQQAFISIEIFLSVSYPKRFIKLRSKKYSVIISCLLFILLIVINLQYVIYYLDIKVDEHSYGDDVVLNFFPILIYHFRKI